jgi:hypothetical protein
VGHCITRDSLDLQTSLHSLVWRLNQSWDDQHANTGDTGAGGIPITLPPAQLLLADGAGTSTGAQQLSVGDIATVAVQVLPGPAL